MKRAPYRPCRIVAPYAHTHQFRVKPKDKGETLLDFLCFRLPFHPREEWKKRIEEGLLFINGRCAQSTSAIHALDLIEHHNPGVTEPSVPNQIQVLKETEEFLAVFKPAPMPVHPGGRYFKQTLTEILKSKGWRSLHIVHRLDAVTSGIVVFAKSATIARKVSQLYQESGVQKEYIALVKGIPSLSHWTVSLPIRRKQGFKFEVVQGLTEDISAKSALSEFFLTGVLSSGRSIIRCIPHTGRTHQLRLHLSSSGHPILDDDTYHFQTKENKVDVQRKGIALFHAYCAYPELGFEVRSPVPPEWVDEYEYPLSTEEHLRV